MFRAGNSCILWISNQSFVNLQIILVKIHIPHGNPTQSGVELKGALIRGGITKMKR